MKAILTFIEHEGNLYSKDYDKKRLNRTYIIDDEIQMMQPCYFYCDDDDYEGFVTSNVQDVVEKHNHVVVKTGHSHYILEVVDGNN